MNFASPESLVQSQQAQINAMFSIANVVLGGAERFVPITQKLIRESLDETAQLMQTLVAARSPEELMQASSQTVAPVVDRCTGFARSICELAISNQRELVRHLDTNVAKLNHSLSSALDAVGQNAPAGSDMAVAAVKSAMVAANSTFASLNKATLQVADLTAGQLDKLSEVGSKAVAAATPAAKPVGKAARKPS